MSRKIPRRVTNEEHSALASRLRHIELLYERRRDKGLVDGTSILSTPPLRAGPPGTGKSKGITPMKLLSVNAATLQNVPYRGRTVMTGIFKEPLKGRIKAQRLGLEGDRQADLSVHPEAGQGDLRVPLRALRLLDSRTGAQRPYLWTVWGKLHRGRNA